MNIASIVVNAVLFIATTAVVLSCFHKDGRWQFKKGLKIFRYFTVLSNVLCALSALAVAIAQVGGALPFGVMAFKYVGTVSVTVTLLTVFLFLGPSMGGYKALLSGGDLYMHLIGPLLAILSFRCLEKQPMAAGTALLGALPVALYGLLYLHKVVYAPQDRRWEDFYGFNRNGKWPIAFAAMLAGTMGICVVMAM